MFVIVGVKQEKRISDVFQKLSVLFMIIMKNEQASTLLQFYSLLPLISRQAFPLVKFTLLNFIHQHYSCNIMLLTPTIKFSLIHTSSLQRNWHVKKKFNHCFSTSWQLTDSIDYFYSCGETKKLTTTRRDLV